MAELSLALLGPSTAVYDQRPLTQFRTKAVQALLTYLTCQQEAHAREALMALLWPELPTKSAQGNLRYALYHLRQAIPTVTDASGADVPFVLADRQTIQVNPDGRFQLDVTQFERLTVSRQAEDWATAVLLYRADFLADFYLPDSPEFESWAQTRRADLRRRLLLTLGRLGSHALDAGDLGQAEMYARRQLEIDNLHEEAHRQLMRVLARDGRRAAALTHYQEMCQLLHDELDITPASETEALVVAIRSDGLKKDVLEKERREKEQVSRPVPHNLPAHATPFIGRQMELAALDDLFADPQTRLVTILGAGGMGKTRLSLAAAERQLVRAQFPDGVFFVPLAGLSDSERITAVITEAMQVRLEQGEGQLLSYLRAKRLLLVLDNFEHLLDGSDLVSRLLQAAPQVQILVTSRERLRLQGEQVYPIQGLAVDATAVTDDARALFLQAARRLRPDFEVTADYLPALNHICQLVEGMPLALALAAAWVDVFTLEEIAAEIERNLDFLASDFRDIPARHRSMQAVFDASWQQLTPAEQQLLTQLTIFKGGFTRAAMTAVTHASARDLAVLANKSLLTFEATNGRYHMHELLRQFSAAQGEAETALLDRHSHYYCHWVAAQLDGLVGAEQMSVGRQINTDMDNLYTAVIHALQREHFADLAQALPALSEYYRTYGHLKEGIHLLQQVYAVLDRQPDLAPFILFWTSMWLSEFYGMLERANSETFLQKAVGLLETPFFNQRDTRAERARIWHEKGYHLFRHEPEKAVQLFRQSLALQEKQEDRVWSIRTRIGLARAVRNVGDLDQAQRLTEQSLHLARALGNPLLQIDAQLLLANLAGRQEQFDEAEAQLQQSIGQLRQINQPFLLALGLLNLGFFQLEKGHFDAAIQTTQECHQIYLDLDNRPFQVLAQLVIANCWLHLGEYTRCSAISQAITGEAQAIATNPHGQKWLHLLFAQLAMIDGDMTQARKQLHTGDWGDWQFCLGTIAVIEGDLITAQNFLAAVIRGAIEHHLTRTVAVSLTLAAYLTAIKGAPEQAIALYTVAQQNPFVANSRWFEDVVGKRITAVTQTLSPEAIAAAQTKGQTLDMWQTAASLLG